MTVTRERASPNFNDRAGGVRPSIIVIHYTGTATAQEAEDVYMNITPDPSSGPVSPHYMIAEDGTVTRFVPEERRAWHAGESWWNGKADINSHSIGIELVNAGHAGGCPPFKSAQMDALAGLIGAIVGRHGIAAHNIVGHSDIAPHRSRKIDPGEAFDWEWLAVQGFGLYPRPEQDDYAMAQVLYADMAGLRQGLSQYGYDPRISDDDAISAFQRHFQAEAFRRGTQGIPDAETGARLHWLLRAKNRICGL